MALSEESKNAIDSSRERDVVNQAINDAKNDKSNPPGENELKRAGKFWGSLGTSELLRSKEDRQADADRKVYLEAQDRYKNGK